MAIYNFIPVRTSFLPSTRNNSISPRFRRITQWKKTYFLTECDFAGDLIRKNTRQVRELSFNTHHWNSFKVGW